MRIQHKATIHKTEAKGVYTSCTGGSSHDSSWDTLRLSPIQKESSRSQVNHLQCNPDSLSFIIESETNYFTVATFQFTQITHFCCLVTHANCKEHGGIHYEMRPTYDGCQLGRRKIHC